MERPKATNFIFLLTILITACEGIDDEEKHYSVYTMKWKAEGFIGKISEIQTLVRKEDGTTNTSEPIDYDWIKNTSIVGSIDRFLGYGDYFYEVSSEGSTEVLPDDTGVIISLRETVVPDVINITGGDIEDREKYCVRWRILNDNRGTSVNKVASVIRKADKNALDNNGMLIWNPVSSASSDAFNPNSTYEIIVILHSKVQLTPDDEEKHYNVYALKWEAKGFIGKISEMQIFVRKEDGATSTSGPIDYELIKNTSLSKSSYRLLDYGDYLYEVSSEGSTRVFPGAMGAISTTRIETSVIPDVINITGGDIEDREKYCVRWRILNVNRGTSVNKVASIISKADKNDMVWSLMSSSSSDGYNPNSTYEIIVILYSNVQPTPEPVATTTKPEVTTSNGERFEPSFFLLAAVSVLLLYIPLN